MCNAGLALGAIAIYEEEDILSKQIINRAISSVKIAMKEYGPDGVYIEGYGYWNYGTTYNVIALALLEDTLDTDFGLAKTAAFDRTADYRLYVQSPAGLGFNYADGSAPIGLSPAYTWLAQHFGSAQVRAHTRDLLNFGLSQKRPERESDRFLALNAVWFPSPIESQNLQAANPSPLDARFRGPAQLALFRSAWNDPRALFLGFKAGGNGVNHSHLDLGSFVLDADGVRWAQDLGPDDYNLPAYFGAKRWTYFRLNNFSHNTLTPGSALQAPKAEAPIIAFASTPSRAYAVADLSAAYPTSAKKFLRGVAFLDRARVLVQDEVTALAANTPLTWRLVTDTKIKIIDAHHAELTQSGKTLRAEILEPATAQFTAAPATPATSAEKPNRGTTILAATIPPQNQITDARLIVLLTPVGDHWPAALPVPTTSALAQW